MNTILYLDFNHDSVVTQELKQRDLNLIWLSRDSQNQGVAWPNLLKRCGCVLVSGASGLTDDDPELEALLEPYLSSGLHIEVWSQSQPMVNIQKALIGGIHYQFGIDFSKPDVICHLVDDLLISQPPEQSSAF